MHRFLLFLLTGLILSSCLKKGAFKAVDNVGIQHTFCSEEDGSLTQELDSILAQQVIIEVDEAIFQLMETSQGIGPAFFDFDPASGNKYYLYRLLFESPERDHDQANSFAEINKKDDILNIESEINVQFSLGEEGNFFYFVYLTVPQDYEGYAINGIIKKDEHNFLGGSTNDQEYWYSQ